MATILTTNNGAVKVYINGIFDRSLPKGTFSVSNTGKRLKLEHPSFSTAVQVDLTTTLDGNAYESLDGLADALSAFNRGGTGPSPSDGVQSVTGDFVDNTDPANPVVNHPDTSQVHHEGLLPGNPNSIDYDGDLKSFLIALSGETQGLIDLSGDLNLGDGQFLVGTADGNEKRALQADDIRTNQGGTGTHVATILPQLNQIGPSMPFRNTPIANSLAQRSGDGRLKASNGVDSDDAVVVGQLNEALEDVVKTVDGTVPESLLPSYIDNVQEGTLATFPNPGMSNIVYLDTETNKPYRWGVSSYVEINSGGVALGETAATAYRGDRGKIAYDHTFDLDNPHGVTPDQIGLGDVNDRLDNAEGRLDNIDTSIDDLNEVVDGKADLVDGKIPLEQLPDNQGGGGMGIIAQRTLDFPSKIVRVEIPEGASEVLDVELYITNTSGPVWIGMIINDVITGTYKTISHNVNSVSYNRYYWYNHNRIRVQSGDNGPMSSLTANRRVYGTLNNRPGEVKTWMGKSSTMGMSPGQAPDITDVWGASLEPSTTQGKVLSITFEAMGNITMSEGTRLTIRSK